MILRTLNAYTSARRLTVPVQIIDSVSLSSLKAPAGSIAVFPDIAKGSLYVGPIATLALRATQVRSQSTPASGGLASVPTKVTQAVSEFAWSEAIEKSAKGVVAAGVPLSLTTLPNITTAADLSRTLVTYNVAPDVAKSFADTLFASLKTEGGFAFCVGAAGGVLTLFVLDAAKVRWSLATKLLAAVVVAIALAVVVVSLVERGVLQKPGSSEVRPDNAASPSKR